MESKEIKQRFALVKKEVAPFIEVPEKMKPMLEKFKRVVHYEFLKGLQPMRDIQRHDASIFHDFEDPFIWKESVRDESFKFFKLISPTICTQRVLHGGATCSTRYAKFHLSSHFERFSSWRRTYEV